MAGGIPLIRPLRESLAGERHPPRHGHRQRHDQLHPHPHDRGRRRRSPTRSPRRRRSGYAERDPTADVEGFDAAAKAAIIASIAFGARVVAGDVYREGIASVTADDIAFAARPRLRREAARGRRRRSTATIAVRVHPAMVPVAHPLASVRDSFNAVFIEGDAVGELMLYGRGAGGDADGERRARRPRRRGARTCVAGARGDGRLHVARRADPARSTR